jgi:hypothetical protein
VAAVHGQQEHPELSRGVPSADLVTGQLPIIRHRCDEPSCQAIAHLTTGSPADNTADYHARCLDPLSPLWDTRGPRGRAVAIRNDIWAAIAEGAGLGETELAIETASAACLPDARLALPF